MAFVTLPSLPAGHNILGSELQTMLSGITEVRSVSARKTADQSVTSSTTLVNDTHLFVSVAASTEYRVRLDAIYTAGTGGNIKFTFTFPAGATLSMSGMGYLVGSTTYQIDMTAVTSVTSGTTTLSYGGGGGVMAAAIHGTLVVGATAGTLQLKWAQNSSDGTATVMKSPSSLTLIKVA